MKILIKLPKKPTLIKGFNAGGKVAIVDEKSQKPMAIIRYIRNEGFWRTPLIEIKFLGTDKVDSDK